MTTTDSELEERARKYCQQFNDTPFKVGPIALCQFAKSEIARAVEEDRARIVREFRAWDNSPVGDWSGIEVVQIIRDEKIVSGEK